MKKLLMVAVLMAVLPSVASAKDKSSARDTRVVLIAEPVEIKPGERVTLTWQIDEKTVRVCFASGGPRLTSWGEGVKRMPIKGTWTSEPLTETTRFGLTCVDNTRNHDMCSTSVEVRVIKPTQEKK